MNCKNIDEMHDREFSTQLLFDLFTFNVFVNKIN